MESKGLEETLLKVLRKYLRARGVMVLSLAKASNQKHIRIEIKALYWYYRGLGIHNSFTEFYRILREKHRSFIYVNNYTIELGENEIKIPIDLINYILSTQTQYSDPWN
ncbi:MAG: hypothetical protein J7K21_02685 [Desulfurococcales archaeon]|nr:hypothetical protein [Desulfurococcales archaeon]